MEQSLRTPDAGEGAAQTLPWRVRTSRHTDDLTQHMKMLTAWEQRYDQLSRGAFKGAVTEAWVGGIQIFEERLSQAVFQSGIGRPGNLSLGVFSALSGEARWQGVPVGFDHVSCLTRKHALELSTPQESSLLGLSIPTHMCPTLDEAFRLRGRDGCIETLDSSLVLSSGLAAAMRCRLGTALLVLTYQPENLALEAARRQLASEIVGLVEAYVAAALDTDAIPSPAKARRVVSVARDYIMAHPDEPLTVTDLCQQTFTSRRTLQYCFEQVVGMSPAAYLKVVRLNGVRRDLALSEGHVTVGDAAARWGFWHLSQFSLDYKKQFGELPSHTLRRLS